jgi:hypothetical protein
MPRVGAMGFRVWVFRARAAKGKRFRSPQPSVEKRVVATPTGRERNGLAQPEITSRTLFASALGLLSEPARGRVLRAHSTL